MRIAGSLAGAQRRLLPVRMYVAGGAAMHFYTGERVSEDIDASFSRRLALPEDLEVAYRDADGAARLLYFDRQYNDSMGLLHEDAYDDSMPLSLDGIDSSIVEVRLLSPTDLAVSKIGRLEDQDRHDIAALARHGLTNAELVRQRAEQAMSGYIGDLERLRNSIEIATRVIADAERTAKRRRRGR
ncbi:MAG TPA: DUF6036 family nucleotidyltransferase [Steroidobacteraceae bacterium]|nr:DUF6036 family nucleotidyltransferase [Steroidobacteraceae bacterium]